jgi:RNase P/RNase MRP subunit POP5
MLLVRVRVVDMASCPIQNAIRTFPYSIMSQKRIKMSHISRAIRSIHERIFGECSTGAPQCRWLAFSEIAEPNLAMANANEFEELA